MQTTSVPTQPLSAKKGEVIFRKKLTQQHFTDKQVFPQEYTKNEMQQVLLKRTDRARKDFIYLQQRGIPLSPFLEIGAGHGHASLVLANEFGATGFATDLANEPLVSIHKTAKELSFSRLPKLLICDTERLPFADNSFPFIFCYQTLHHFPHPAAVTREIARVLVPGGWFFFAEEPVKQKFNLSLWYRPTKLRWWEKILKATLILPFISRIGKTEIEHGILEETFTLGVWKEALDKFYCVEANLAPFPFGPQGTLKKISGRWDRKNFRSFFNRLFLFFLGGEIRAIAQKRPHTKAQKNLRILPQLRCVNCPPDNLGRRPLLKKKLKKLSCPICSASYPQMKQVPILLPKKLMQDLYPKFL